MLSVFSSCIILSEIKIFSSDQKIIPGKLTISKSENHIRDASKIKYFPNGQVDIYSTYEEDETPQTSYIYDETNF